MSRRVILKAVIEVDAWVVDDRSLYPRVSEALRQLADHNERDEGPVRCGALIEEPGLKVRILMEQAERLGGCD